MIEPTQKQKEALNYLKYTNVFFHGGHATGKKTLCVIALVKYCIENKNKSCLFFSKGFVNTTVDVFIDVLKKGFPTVGFNYTKIDKKITFNNGSVVYFKDEKQENGIVFYDFVAGLNFNIEKIRCHKYLLCSNDIYNIAGAIYIYCSYRDNPFLSEKYKQDFIGYNNQSNIAFICHPILKYEDISKPFDSLEEKILKLKTTLADLEIKRLEAPKGDNRINYELGKLIEDLKCTIKTLE